jgi:uncharacterized protein YjiS (DUF1127 family)
MRIGRTGTGETRMFFATAAVPTDLDIHEPVMNAIRAAAAALRAAVARAHERRGYRQLLARDEACLQDVGVTREQVRKALADC